MQQINILDLRTHTQNQQIPDSSSCNQTATFKDLLKVKHYDKLEQLCHNNTIQNRRFFRDKSNEVKIKSKSNSRSCLIITNFRTMGWHLIVIRFSLNCLRNLGIAKSKREPKYFQVPYRQIKTFKCSSTIPQIFDSTPNSSAPHHHYLWTQPNHIHMK